MYPYFLHYLCSVNQTKNLVGGILFLLLTYKLYFRKNELLYY